MTMNGFYQDTLILTSIMPLGSTAGKEMLLSWHEITA